jgi:hypothetical protein
MFLVFAISNQLYLFNVKTLKVGGKAKKNIIAPTPMKFNDENKKRKVIENILENSEGVFIRSQSVEANAFLELQNFYNTFMTFEKANVIEYLTIKMPDLEFKVLRKIADITERSVKEALKEETIQQLNALFNEGLKNTENTLESKKEALTGEESLSYIIALQFARPNMLYDYSKTEKKFETEIANIEDMTVSIDAGDILVKKGEIVTEEKMDLLERFGLYSVTTNFKIFVGTILYTITLSGLFFFILKETQKLRILNRNYYYSTLIILLIILTVTRLVSNQLIWIIPFEAVALLLGILVSMSYALTFSVFMLLYIFPLIGFNYLLFTVSIFSMILVVNSIKSIKNRTDLVNAGIYIGLTKVLVGTALFWIAKKEFFFIIFTGVELLLSGILSGMITIALLPYFENSFNILTKLKLIELGDLSHPLLRKMSLEAPGTFNHSMLVATLSEQAAEAIGANSTFTRVACYYHDVGKMKRPNFYVENQSNGINPHNTLTPTLSTIIIKAHTKDGQEMGKKFKIPVEIRNIMAEHQGTTLLAYFYNKAKKENPEINENDFRYDGPKPKVRSQL